MEELCCKICLKGPFLKAAKFQRHMLIHSQEKIFKCPQCKSSFKRNDHLRRHIRSVHSDNPKPYKCPEEECPYGQYGFVDNYHLQRHLSTAHSSKLSCLSCNLVFRKRTQFTKHQVKCHNEQPPYKCSLCEPSKPFFSRVLFEKHLTKDIHEECKKQRNNQESPQSCPLCLVLLKSKKQLSRHLKEVHQKSETLHLCAKCGKAFAHRRNLLAHIRTKHSEGAKFRCTRCDSSYFHKKSLIIHEREKHFVELEGLAQVE